MFICTRSNQSITIYHREKETAFRKGTKCWIWFFGLFRHPLYSFKLHTPFKLSSSQSDSILCQIQKQRSLTLFSYTVHVEAHNSTTAHQCICSNLSWVYTEQERFFWLSGSSFLSFKKSHEFWWCNQFSIVRTAAGKTSDSYVYGLSRGIDAGNWFDSLQAGSISLCSKAFSQFLSSSLQGLFLSVIGRPVLDIFEISKQVHQSALIDRKVTWLRRGWQKIKHLYWWECTFELWDARAGWEKVQHNITTIFIN